MWLIVRFGGVSSSLRRTASRWAVLLRNPLGFIQWGERQSTHTSSLPTLYNHDWILALYQIFKNHIISLILLILKFHILLILVFVLLPIFVLGSFHLCLALRINPWFISSSILSWPITDDDDLFWFHAFPLASISLISDSLNGSRRITYILLKVVIYLTSCSFYFYYVQSN